MRAHTLTAVLSGAALATTMLSACSFRAADLNNLQLSDFACAPAPEQRSLTRDLTFDFISMNPHNSQHNTFDVLRPNRSLAARIVLERPTFSVDDPNTAPVECTRVVFPTVIPPDSVEGSYRIEFWADFNDNWDADHYPNNTPMGDRPRDHTWAQEICDDGVIRFIHNTNFTDLVSVRPGTDMVIPLSGMQLQNIGRLFENTFPADSSSRASITTTAVRVWLRREGQLQGIFDRPCLFTSPDRPGCEPPRVDGPRRLIDDTAEPTELRIPSIIVDGNYQAEIFLDVNNDHRPDACDFRCTVDGTVGSGGQISFAFSEGTCGTPSDDATLCARQLEPECRPATVLADGGVVR